MRPSWLLLTLLAAPAAPAQTLLAALGDGAQGLAAINIGAGGALVPLGGVGVDAMAYDPLNGRIWFSDGPLLYQYAGGASLRGQLMFLGAPISPSGMGFYGGQLYFVTNTLPEALYRVDTDTGQVTLQTLLQPQNAVDIGGFDIDRATGRFYGSNDDPLLRGIVEIDPVSGLSTLLAPYPAGEDDVDGLAAGDGRLFLITDDDTPATFAVYDADAHVYEPGSIPNPFTGSHDGAGGAYIPAASASVPDGGGYSFRDCHAAGGPGAPFVDISATGTALGLSDDAEANITLPFSFPFYGVWHSALRVGNNGGIIVGATSGDVFASPPNTLPIASGGFGPGIMPFWDDLDSETGNVYWQSFPSCPNPDGGPGACAVVQWHQRPHYSASTGTATLQALIYANGSVLFHYLDVDFDNLAWDYGASALIGMQQGNVDPAARQFLLYSFDRPKAVREGCPILFSRRSRIQLAVTAQLDTNGVPNDECGTSGFLTVDPGAAVEVCYRATNLGDVALTRHDLETTPFGNLMSSFPYSLAAGASAYYSKSVTVTVPTTFSGSWTAYNPGPVDVASANGEMLVNVTGPLGLPIFADGFEAATMKATLPAAAPR